MNHKCLAFQYLILSQHFYFPLPKHQALIEKSCRNTRLSTYSNILVTKGQALEGRINSITLLNTHLYFCSMDVYGCIVRQKLELTKQLTMSLKSSSTTYNYKIVINQYEKSLNASQGCSAGHQNKRSQNCCKVVSRKIKQQETLSTLASFN